MSYILEVQEDENGDQYITFPDEVVEELGWQEGDVLNWDVRGTGIIITKVNDAAGYEVIEEQNSPNSGSIQSAELSYTTQWLLRHGNGQ